jgi:hypothetical protein
MTAVEPASADSDALHLYVAIRAWPMIVDLVEGLHDAQDLSVAFVGTAQAFAIDRLPYAVEAERLLDRYWIIHVRGDEEGRRDAELCFFDRIADRYELEIDPRRNRDNVRTLIQLAGVRPGARVLDFGCGPGLSVREADQIALVGCDVSPAMREQAAAHRLLTVGPEDLPKLESSFDAMVASYVFHLAVPLIDLLAAMRSVRRGGRVAANFHKNRGFVDTTVSILREGLFAIDEQASTDHVLHGAIRVWERIS